MVLISFVKLYEIHIFPKVEGSSSKMNGFLSLYSSDFRGAWQAQFLSHNLVTFKKYVFSIVDQMILISFFHIPNPNPVILEKPILAVYSRPQHGIFSHVAA